MLLPKALGISLNSYIWLSLTEIIISLTRKSFSSAEEFSKTLPIIGANEAIPKKKNMLNKAIHAENILKKLPARRIIIFW